ncbi:hypothetical protein FGO68_gene7827 [Halteria grandinella]|uniref:Uncharacterized protein n=1 Tax=Halteria grandinella TaxID=5974 RepID=A0A8J8NCF6_HALGN|nr:hypothetical protein FGO68_gene7827 [Halteria grandinella]
MWPESPIINKARLRFYQVMLKYNCQLSLFLSQNLSQLLNLVLKFLNPTNSKSFLIKWTTVGLIVQIPRSSSHPQICPLYVQTTSLY